MIYEGENAFSVVSGDELCWLTNIVHVCTVGRASDLQGKTHTLLSDLVRAAFSWPGSPAVRFVGSQGTTSDRTVQLCGLLGQGNVEPLKDATHLESANSHEAKLAALASVRVIIRQ